MPELPEVETVVRTLRPRLTGRRVLATSGFEAPVAGLTIQSVERHGKFIVIAFETGLLLVHLGMTGKLLVDGLEGKHTRARLVLDGSVVLYDDIRKFGRIRWSPVRPPLGPDPLEISEGEFIERLRARQGIVKPLLLNQSFLRGLGNIYVDEALHRAGIHPRTRASRITSPRARRLHAAIVEVLTEAIAAGGSSISDYVDATGAPGSFQRSHRVYGRAGSACLDCGTAIRRIVVSQRGTHFCPSCQRRA
ncbi:MAG: bifunctional DNA-formamidopyrimidine glycosylase/DNA-(apurinic or apyrimidinic site) lyase [Acidobacteria bacterium]|nr:bifunctional DNA-formamidopyrimidine glycosylase/DNA-(apurinic or apyrimidinic site) lyase [Acidobacteriota bacterium]